MREEQPRCILRLTILVLTVGFADVTFTPGVRSCAGRGTHERRSRALIRRARFLSVLQSPCA
eukprot:1196101-Prorocentrum_minimum.AAC.5